MPLKVMHLIDALNTGGAERVVVNLVNSMPRDSYRIFVGMTRSRGVMSALLANDVGQICLERRNRLDFFAIRRLAKFLRKEQIDILHVHGSSIFTASLLSWLIKTPVVIWHDHYGPNATTERSVRIYRYLLRPAVGVIAVSESLAKWSVDRLGFTPNKVWYLPNFPLPSAVNSTESINLPGVTGSRVACVANFRIEKDHLSLLQAFSTVSQNHPDAHLLLIGETVDPDCGAAIEAKIDELDLGHCVTILGQRSDVAEILAQCDLGVLSSTAEGLPLSVLEYGSAGLATIVTDVGQCPHVVDHGAAGLIVPPRSSEALANAMLRLLKSTEERKSLGESFRTRVERCFSAEATVSQLSSIYSQLLNERASR